MGRLVLCATVLTFAFTWPARGYGQTGQVPTAVPMIVPQSDLAQATNLGGFSVVLVLGELQASATASDIPSVAAKAIADLKDFLPYKTYRLLDAQWTMNGGQSKIVNRLRGPEGKEYELQLASLPGRLVRMAQSNEVLVSLFRLRELDPNDRVREEIGLPTRAARGLSGPGDVSGAVIDTSFSMNVGETVVVGTSRIQGDKALIVLLTAVPKTGRNF